MKNRISLKRILFLSLTALLLLATGFMIITSKEWVQCDPLVVTTLTINIVLFMVQLLRAINAHPFSFDMMFWLFSLYFFGFVPMLQHFANRYSWNLVPELNEVVGANMLVLLWSVCYILGRDLRIPRLVKLGQKLGAKLRSLCGHLISRLGKFLSPLDKILCTRSNLIMNVLLLVSVVITVVDVALVGFAGQLARSTASIGTGSTTADLLLVHGCNNTLLFIAVMHIIRAKRNKRLDWQTLLSLVCLGIACFPTGLSRSTMASFYAGLLIIMFDQTRKGHWFSWAVIGGLVLIFPALAIFRDASNISNGNFLSILKASMQRTYLEGHYDAHQMLITIVRYVQEFGMTWGGQLLGAVFFFVPRAIWPGKALGTGHTAVTALEQSTFSNVSAPLVAEGYVNFGVVGVILFAVILGILLRRLDESYWRADTQLRLIRVVYPFSMLMFFFLLRGDMLSAWAYTAAQALVGTVIYSLCRHSIAQEK